MENSDLVLWVLSALVTALGVILLAIGNRVLGSMDEMQKTIAQLREEINNKISVVKSELYSDFVDLRDRVSHLEGRIDNFLKGRHD